MDWIKEKKESLIFLGLVIFGLLVFGLISRVVFYYLGLELCDLREIGGSQETGVTNKDKLIERAFTIIGGIVGGIIAVIGLSALTWRLILMERQTKISQKSQYTEQFLKSVEQTANENLGVFLGGLASLDALSRENKEEYRRVWKYLSDFLRYDEPLKSEMEKPHPKVEAIAKMLRERKREKYEDFKFNLADAHLEGAGLYIVYLENANLAEAHLEGANLFCANLKYANLYKTHLEGAGLWGANLYGASLDRAYLDRAKLERALFGGKIESGEVQDLTALKPEQLRGTYYDKDYPMPKLPDGISEEDKPKAISYYEWFDRYGRKKLIT